MLSNVLLNFLGELEADSSSPKNQAAARDARLKLNHEVSNEGHACKSCEKAHWIVNFWKQPAGGFEELFFSLGSCAGGLNLKPNSDGAGLQMPVTPFYCTVRTVQGGSSGAASKVDRAAASTPGALINRLRERGG